MLSIITSVAGLISTFIKGKYEIAKAKNDREVKALTNEADWNIVQADASRGSWKDEWLTLLVSIPLIMAFIPSLAPYVSEGFKALDTMPEWYRYSVGIVFAASFGVKKATELLSRR